MSTTIVRHLLAELKALGIRDIFGVPGDYAFPLDDAIQQDPELRWIGCCNELNAGYAADGYARMKGLSVLCTTFGVGELSAMGAIAGAYAEHLPVIHLVGIPASTSAAERRVLHHTLGTGKFHIYAKMYASITAAWTVLTPENAVSEIRRVLWTALRERRPVYLALPMDYAEMKIEASVLPFPKIVSDEGVLEKAVQTVADMLNKAVSPVVLPGYMIGRLGLESSVIRLLESGNLSFATMMMDKSVLNEQSKRYLGVYDGEILPGRVRDRVEQSDCVLNLGAIWSDFNTGSFTARLKKDRVIVAGIHRVVVGDTVFHDVELSDFIRGLAPLLTPHENEVFPYAEYPFAAPVPERYMDDVYRQLAAFLEKDDILVVETGTSSVAMSAARLPSGCRFVNQTLWGAIGWATPAAFGIALAEPERRVILLTGEGAHQLTAQEICQFQRYNLNPLIFVVNNGGYQIERILNDNMNLHYNDLPEWSYPLLPEAFGDKRMQTGRVTGAEEWKKMLKLLEQGVSNGAYVEIVTCKEDIPSLLRRIRERRFHLYK